MKDLEKLKTEQEELKGRLTRLIEFINSGEYYQCSEQEKSLLNSQRMGMEIYLDSLTKRIYDADNFSSTFGSSFWPLLMLSMFNNPFSSSSSTSFDKLSKDLLDTQKTTEDSKEAIYEVPNNKN